MKNSWKRIDPIGLFYLCCFCRDGMWHRKVEPIPPYLLPSQKRFCWVMADFASSIAKLTPYSGRVA